MHQTKQATAIGPIIFMALAMIAFSPAFARSPSYKMTFESTKACQQSGDFIERLAMQPEEFRGARKYDRGNISPRCVHSVMSDFPADKNLFGECAIRDTSPVKGANKPCLSRQYFYSVYNAFTDVADCYGLSQKALLPKIRNESGFHINALGPFGDAGIGQLTGAAISEVNRNYDRLVTDHLRGSEKTSCKRLYAFREAWQKADADMSKRCAVMVGPYNPVRSLIYMAALHRQNHMQISYFMKRLQIGDREYNLYKMAREAGFEIDHQKDSERLIEILATLGYNTGSKTAVILLKNYLERKIRLRSESENKESLLKTYKKLSVAERDMLKTDRRWQRENRRRLQRVLDLESMVRSARRQVKYHLEYIEKNRGRLRQLYENYKQGSAELKVLEAAAGSDDEKEISAEEVRELDRLRLDTKIKMSVMNSLLREIKAARQVFSEQQAVLKKAQVRLPRAKLAHEDWQLHRIRLPQKLQLYIQLDPYRNVGDLGRGDFDFSVSTDHLKKYRNRLPHKHEAVHLKRLGFAEFLQIYQPVGTKGYLSILYRSKEIMDKKHGVNRCTDKNYLKL